MKANLFLLAGLLISPLVKGQNISASRSPMYFGETRKPVEVARFKSEAVKENNGIDFGYPLCPLCHRSMTQIYSDTAMIDREHKWIKVVQCNGGNKVLLSKTIGPAFGLMSFYLLQGK